MENVLVALGLLVCFLIGGFLAYYLLAYFTSKEDNLGLKIDTAAQVIIAIALVVIAVAFCVKDFRAEISANHITFSGEK